MYAMNTLTFIAISLIAIGILFNWLGRIRQKWEDEQRDKPTSEE